MWTGEQVYEGACCWERKRTDGRTRRGTNMRLKDGDIQLTQKCKWGLNKRLGRYCKTDFYENQITPRCSGRKLGMEDEGEKDDKSETTDEDEKGWREPI